jgi:SAM-dependent methyltransferase
MKEVRAGVKCPFCSQAVDGNLGAHIRQQHGEDQFRQAVLNAKARGAPDVEIGERFGISFRQLEQVITEAYGTNISILERPKQIKAWQPKDFREEANSVWSFKRRGNWATHDGRYRGNWSPYIPRNVILKYSHPGDTVLDYFAGGGTTAVEAKLLGRRCIVRDINPGAVGLILENLSFTPPLGLFSGEIYEPEVSVGDARDLSDIPSCSIGLICAHPPYAGIISYSSAVEGDLSKLSVPDFLSEMDKVARESLRVLKPGGKCAILIGDARKSKRVVPIGFQTIRVFLDAGFTLRELVIKRQHNCKTTGFWYARSIQYNFLLLAHEYLPVFEKPAERRLAEQRSFWEYGLPRQVRVERIRRDGQEEGLETTTVWIFPKDRLGIESKRNLLQRFSIAESEFVEVEFSNGNSDLDTAPHQNVSLVYVRSPERTTDESVLVGYRASIKAIVEQAAKLLPKDGFIALEASDVRIGETFWPVGLFLYEDMAERQDFALKEIVIVVPEESSENSLGNHLEIVHRYLLIYTRK